jgi:hypothetical protein
MKHNIDLWHAKLVFHPKIWNHLTHTNYASPPGPALGTTRKSLTLTLASPTSPFPLWCYSQDSSKVAQWLPAKEHLPLTVKKASSWVPSGFTELERLCVETRNLSFKQHPHPPLTMIYLCTELRKLLRLDYLKPPSLWSFYSLFLKCIRQMQLYVSVHQCYWKNLSLV